MCTDSLYNCNVAHWNLSNNNVRIKLYKYNPKIRGPFVMQHFVALAFEHILLGNSSFNNHLAANEKSCTLKTELKGQ